PSLSSPWMSTCNVASRLTLAGKIPAERTIGGLLEGDPSTETGRRSGLEGGASEVGSAVQPPIMIATIRRTVRAGNFMGFLLGSRDTALTNILSLAPVGPAHVAHVHGGK